MPSANAIINFSQKFIDIYGERNKTDDRYLDFLRFINAINRIKNEDTERQVLKEFLKRSEKQYPYEGLDSFNGQQQPVVITLHKRLIKSFNAGHLKGESLAKWLLHQTACLANNNFKEIETAKIHYAFLLKAMNGIEDFFDNEHYHKIKKQIEAELNSNDKTIQNLANYYLIELLAEEFLKTDSIPPLNNCAHQIASFIKSPVHGVKQQQNRVIELINQIINRLIKNKDCTNVLIFYHLKNVVLDTLKLDNESNDVTLLDEFIRTVKDVAVVEEAIIRAERYLRTFAEPIKTLPIDLIEKTHRLASENTESLIHYIPTEILYGQEKKKHQSKLNNALLCPEKLKKLINNTFINAKLAQTLQNGDNNWLNSLWNAIDRDVLLMLLDRTIDYICLEDENKETYIQIAKELLSYQLVYNKIVNKKFWTESKTHAERSYFVLEFFFADKFPDNMTRKQYAHLAKLKNEPSLFINEENKKRLYKKYTGEKTIGVGLDLAESISDRHLLELHFEEAMSQKSFKHDIKEAPTSTLFHNLELIISIKNLTGRKIVFNYFLASNASDLAKTRVDEIEVEKGFFKNLFKTSFNSNVANGINTKPITKCISNLLLKSYSYSRSGPKFRDKLKEVEPRHFGKLMLESIEINKSDFFKGLYPSYMSAFHNALCDYARYKHHKPIAAYFTSRLKQQQAKYAPEKPDEPLEAALQVYADYLKMCRPLSDKLIVIHDGELDLNGKRNFLLQEIDALINFTVTIMPTLSKNILGDLLSLYNEWHYLLESFKKDSRFKFTATTTLSFKAFIDKTNLSVDVDFLVLANEAIPKPQSKRFMKIINGILETKDVSEVYKNGEALLEKAGDGSYNFFSDLMQDITSLKKNLIESTKKEYATLAFYYLCRFCYVRSEKLSFNSFFSKSNKENLLQELYENMLGYLNSYNIVDNFDLPTLDNIFELKEGVIIDILNMIETLLEHHEHISNSSIVDTVLICACADSLLHNLEDPISDDENENNNNNNNLSPEEQIPYHLTKDKIRNFLNDIKNELPNNIKDTIVTKLHATKRTWKNTGDFLTNLDCLVTAKVVEPASPSIDPMNLDL